MSAQRAPSGPTTAGTGLGFSAGGGGGGINGAESSEWKQSVDQQVQDFAAQPSEVVARKTRQNTPTDRVNRFMAVGPPAELRGIIPPRLHTQRGKTGQAELGLTEKGRLPDENMLLIMGIRITSVFGSTESPAGLHHGDRHPVPALRQALPPQRGTIWEIGTLPEPRMSQTVHRGREDNRAESRSGTGCPHGESAHRSTRAHRRTTVATQIGTQTRDPRTAADPTRREATDRRGYSRPQSPGRSRSRHGGTRTASRPTDHSDGLRGLRPHLDGILGQTR